jgi:AcrR family transcriptional regulator
MDRLGKDNQIETQIKNSELVQKKHLQIVTGASKLFIKKGYSRTSIREISKATGLTMGNLYDYITKKEDILYLAFNIFHSIWTDVLTEPDVLGIEDPAKQLDVTVRKVLELVSTHQDMVLLMYTESKLLPKTLLRMILEKESSHVECFEKILRRGVDNGVFKIENPFFLANIIVYLLSAWPLRRWNLKRCYKDAEVNDYIANLIKSLVEPQKKSLIRIKRRRRRAPGRK